MEEVIEESKIDAWSPLETGAERNQISEEINLDPADRRGLNFSQGENPLREAVLGPVHTWAEKLPQQLDEGVRIEIDSEEDIEEDLHTLTLNIAHELKTDKRLGFSQQRSPQFSSFVKAFIVKEKLADETSAPQALEKALQVDMDK